jgi:serine/threonine protein kinase
VLNSSKNLYLVMDLVTGGGLFDTVIAETRLSESTARVYFQQLVDGVAYCHSRNVYHCKLKPENLLLSGDKKTLKIADFGMASARSKSDKSELIHSLTGSPNYMAPELIAGDGLNAYDGAKVDVWACGVILYAMLAGSLPFQATTSKDLYKAIGHGSITFPKHFSYDVIKLLRAMLLKDPAKRVTMEEVKPFAWFKVGYEPAIIPQQTPSLVPVSSQSPLESSQAPLPINKQASKDRMSRKIRRKLLGNTSKLSSITSSNSDSLKEPEDENERPSIGNLTEKRRKSAIVKRTSKTEQMVTERANSALATTSSSRSLTPLSIAQSENDDIVTLGEKKITTDAPSRQGMPMQDNASPQSFPQTKQGVVHLSPSRAALRASATTPKTLTGEVLEQIREKGLPGPAIMPHAASSDGCKERSRRTSAADADVPSKLGNLRRPHVRDQDGPISASSSSFQSPQLSFVAQDYQPTIRQPTGIDPSADTALDASNRFRTHRLLTGNLFGRVTSKASEDHDHDSAKANFRPRIPSFGPARSNSRTQGFTRLPSQALHGEIAGANVEEDEVPKSLPPRSDLWVAPPLSPGRALRRTSASLFSSPFQQEAEHANQFQGSSGVSSPKQTPTNERRHLELYGMLDIFKASTARATPKQTRKEDAAQELNISIVNGLASLDQPRKSPLRRKQEASLDSPLTPPDIVVSNSFAIVSDQTASSMKPESSVPILANHVHLETLEAMDVFKPVANPFAIVTDGACGEEECFEEASDLPAQPVGLPAYVLDELRKADHDNGYPPWCALEIDVFEDCDESESNTNTFNPKRRQGELAELIQRIPDVAQSQGTPNFPHPATTSQKTALSEHHPSVQVRKPRPDLTSVIYRHVSQQTSDVALPDQTGSIFERFAE